MNRDANARSAPNNAAYSAGLFVIWEAAAVHRQQILGDLQARFQVLDVYEVRWTPRRVMQNFQRFYSDIDVRGVYHIFNKGSGPCTVITVFDPLPVIEARPTSRGLRLVNARFLDAKRKYREWTGGLEVHCGETPEETRRDTMMLLGLTVDHCQARAGRAGSTSIRALAQDIHGAAGWPSLAQLLETLNQCVRYAVLYERRRSCEELARSRSTAIELMTDDFLALHRILNARPPIPASPHGGRFKVNIDGASLAVAIRFPGDRYFDPSWAASMLEHRVFDEAGYYRLADQDYFNTLAYHALVHASAPTSYRNTLEEAAEQLGREDWTPDLLDNPRRGAQWLDTQLLRHGYCCSRPLDVSVRRRQPTIDGDDHDFALGTVGWPSRLSAAIRRVTGTATSGWLRLRDHALMRMPWVRSLKRSRPSGVPKTTAL